MKLKNIVGSGVRRNVILSVSVQAISLLVSFLLNLIVPRFIDPFQYAYWQSFVLYVGYTGILHFGLLDGIVLRYSQYDYEVLDRQRIRSQLNILFVSTLLFAVLGIVYGMLFCSGTLRLTVILVSLGIISKNLFNYSSYTFQITNRISHYATLIIVQRLSYGVAVAVLLCLGVNSFVWICMAELMGDMIGILLSVVLQRELYFGKPMGLGASFAEWKKNTSAGAILLLANWSAMFLIGGAKLMIDLRWDKLTFGQVSFAFSVSNLFLVFISAVGVVLFPSLKRMEQDRLPQLYGKIRSGITPLLFSMMLLYFPGRLILTAYLPAYERALIYLGTLLPIIVYSSKVSLLTNNYLKAYRLEKKMLLVNAVSIVFCMTALAVGAYCFNSLSLVLACIVFAVMLNSVLSEIAVMRVIGLRLTREFVAEGIVTMGFIAVTNLLPLGYACAAYFGILALYLAFACNPIKNLFRKRRL